MKVFDPIIKTADIISISSDISLSRHQYRNDECVIKHISGLTYPVGKKPVYYNFCDNVDFEKNFLTDLSGQWVAILKSKNYNYYEVITDHFGFQSVFYRYDEKNALDSELIISTSYSALLEYSKDHGLPCHLNHAQFYLAMSSSNLLLRSAFSNNSFCKEIKLLTANEYLTFDTSTNKFQVRNKDFLYDSKNRSYDQLIDTGIQKSIEKIKSLSSFYSDKRIYLSGGRDSRMVLGLLTYIGLNEQFTVAASNPRSSKGASRKVIENDLHVSYYLAQKYKMKFSGIEEQYCRVNLNFEQSLDRVLAQSSQFSWGSLPSNRVTFPACEHLSLRGGGGEIFRATNNAMRTVASLKKVDSKILLQSMDTQSEALFNLYVNTKSIPKDYYNECKKIFCDSFIFDKDKTLEQNIDWHFLHYRNRIHFGHLITSYSKNEITHHPLMQKELLFASSFHDLNTRRDDFICYDILNRLDPQLNNITFDDGYSRYTSKESQLGLSIEDMRNTQNYDEYYKQQNKNSKFINNPQDLNESIIDNREVFTKYRVYLLAINMLFEFMVKEVFNAFQVESIVDNIFLGKVSPTELYLKSIQYKNIEENYNIDKNLIKINGSFNKLYLDRYIDVSNEKLLTMDKKAYRHVAYSIEVDDELKANIYLSQDVLRKFFKVEYAYYIYENGKVVHKQFYIDKNLYTYPNINRKYKYSVIFFLKIFVSVSKSVTIRVRSDSVN